jgi:hypothetical protein
MYVTISDAEVREISQQREYVETMRRWERLHALHRLPRGRVPAGGGDARGRSRVLPGRAPREPTVGCGARRCRVREQERQRPQWRKVARPRPAKEREAERNKACIGHTPTTG